MTARYILDSDHLSLHQRGHEALKRKIFGMSPEQLAIAIISAEELLRGRLAQVHKAKDGEKRVSAYYWLHKTLDYICAFQIVGYDENAESCYAELRRKKIRIGTNDLKIAAVAMSRNAILVTRNKRDFNQIPNLHIEDWSAAPFS